MRVAVMLLAMAWLAPVTAQAPDLQGLIDEGAFQQAYDEGIASATAMGLTLASRAATFYADYQASEEEKALWYGNAEAAADQALELDAQNALTHLYLAQAQGRLGQYRGILDSLGLADSIKAHAERALELDPALVEAKMTLAIWHGEIASRGIGWLYGASQDEALRLMDEAVRTQPDNITFIFERGKLLALFAQTAEATRAYQRVMSLTPTTAADTYIAQRTRQALEVP